MNKKRILTVAAISFVVVLLFSCAVALLTGSKTPSQQAYQACRLMMLNTKGYGVWKLQSARYQTSKAQFDFDDGFNTATCEAIKVGPFWLPGSLAQTAVGSICGPVPMDETQPSAECPRKKFGVSP